MIIILRHMTFFGQIDLTLVSCIIHLRMKIFIINKQIMNATRQSKNAT